MIERSERYEAGYMDAERAVESGAVANPIAAERSAREMLRTYHYERYKDGDGHREFDRGYADAMRDIAVAQGPAVNVY